MDPVAGFWIATAVMGGIAIVESSCRARKEERDKLERKRASAMLDPKMATGQLPDEGALPELPSRPPYLVPVHPETSVSIVDAEPSGVTLDDPSSPGDLAENRDADRVPELQDEIVTYDDLLDAPLVEPPLDDYIDDSAFGTSELIVPEFEEPVFDDPASMYETELEGSSYDAQHVDG
mgnify:CR=1 FL=1